MSDAKPDKEDKHDGGVFSELVSIFKSSEVDEEDIAMCPGNERAKQLHRKTNKIITGMEGVVAPVVLVSTTDFFASKVLYGVVKATDSVAKHIVKKQEEREAREEEAIDECLNKNAESEGAAAATA